jgi:hypothetical protein
VYAFSNFHIGPFKNFKTLPNRQKYYPIFLASKVSVKGIPQVSR